MTAKTFPDTLGQQVQVGDVVAYSVTRGRSSRLRVGIVTKFNQTARSFHCSVELENGMRGFFRHSHNCVKVTDMYKNRFDTPQQKD